MALAGANQHSPSLFKTETSTQVCLPLPALSSRRKVVDPRKAKPKQDVRNMWPARPLEMGGLVLVLGRMCRGAYLVATVPTCVHGMEGLSSELPTLRACPLRSINPQFNDQDPRFPSMHDILYAPKCQFLRQEFYKVDRDAEFVNKETLNVGFHTSAKMQKGPFFSWW